MEQFDYEELIKATDNFSHTCLVGKGSHGCVFRASLSNGRQVAVKKLALKYTTSNNLTSELSIQSSLDRNPNTVKLLGSVDGSVSHNQTLVLVMEFMPNGSLHDSLHSSTETPSWSARFRVVLQVARALESLHERTPPIVHRDVKSTNVMFDAGWNAKLGDFGLAVIRGESSNYRPAGTIGYLDPCYTCPTKLSTKNDVFSFGVLTLELMSGRKPIDVSKSPSSVVEWAASLIKKHHFMAICDPRINPLPNCLVSKFCHIIRIAMQCVASDQTRRPHAREIVTKLETTVPNERLGIATPVVARAIMAKGSDLGSTRSRLISWVNPLLNVILLGRGKKPNMKCLDVDEKEKLGFARKGLLLREILDIRLEDTHGVVD